MNPSFDPASLPLRDIHLPAAVGWWPPAPGWWLAAGLVVALAVWALARYRARRPQRAALQALARALRALAAGDAPAGCVREVSTVLRRYALTANPDRDAVAGLVGRSWLEYLDSRWSRRAFTDGPGRALVTAPYAADVGRGEARELGELGIAWLKAQRS